MLLTSKAISTNGYKLSTFRAAKYFSTQNFNLYRPVLNVSRVKKFATLPSVSVSPLLTISQSLSTNLNKVV